MAYLEVRTLLTLDRIKWLLTTLARGYKASLCCKNVVRNVLTSYYDCETNQSEILDFPKWLFIPVRYAYA
jgi:hypothetical protein